MSEIIGNGEAQASPGDADKDQEERMLLLLIFFLENPSLQVKQTGHRGGAEPGRGRRVQIRNPGADVADGAVEERRRVPQVLFSSGPARFGPEIGGHALGDERDSVAEGERERFGGGEAAAEEGWDHGGFHERENAVRLGTALELRLRISAAAEPHDFRGGIMLFFFFIYAFSQPP